MAAHDQTSTHLLFFNGNGQDPSQLNLIGSTNQFQMMPNNGATASAPNDARKRKMKEVVEAAEPPPPAAPTPQPAANFFTTLQHQQFPPQFSASLHLNLNGNNIEQPWQQPGLVGQSSQLTCNIGQTLHHTQSHVVHNGQTSTQALTQLMMEMSKPFKSYTALLTEDDDDYGLAAIIKNHGDQLRRTLMDMAWKNYVTFVGAAEEKASMKLKEKEMQLHQMMLNNGELQQIAAHFRQELQVAETRIRSLENVVVTLRAQLEDANKRGMHNMMNPPPPPGLHRHEDAGESPSFTDPSHGVKPIKLVCKACNKKVANMMTWPCRHVGLCTICDALARACPVCGTYKMMSIELGLP